MLHGRKLESGTTSTCSHLMVEVVPLAESVKVQITVSGTQPSGKLL
jgi:hypothetical protein